MAEKPLYYGSSKSSPMYYGGSQMSYGGKGPMYYGASRSYGQYGAYGAYGTYGQYGSYGGGAPQDDGSSIVGTITVGRMLRVIAQRWLSVFVFLLIGLIVSFAIYSISPRIYEATSEFTMDIRHAVGRSSSVMDEVLPDLGNNYAEIFNTRLPTWRSPEILKKIVDNYNKENQLRADAKRSVTNDELYSVLAESQMELQRNSRVITISVRSKDPKLAKDLADAYVEAIRQHADEENKKRVEDKVRDTHANVEQKNRERDQLSQAISDFRINNGVDVLRSHRDTLQQSISKTTGDILVLESEVTQLEEWEKVLRDVQKNPEKFGSLASGAPRAQEIATEYNAYQKTAGEHAALLVIYQPAHKEVMAKAQEMELAKQRFLDATTRALETGVANLQAARNRLANLKQKRDVMRTDLASDEQKIVLAESGLTKLESDLKITEDLYKSYFNAEVELRREAQSSDERILAGRKATEPQKPVLPNPLIIFGLGIALSLVLGVLFVLVLDNLEDTVVNLADIEGRLALKVLAVLPHVRRKRREHVAKFTVEDKYSQFSEAVAGLRNLLDSPRYEAMSHCLLVISTQPGEGKTITSTSIAISYAQAGRKVLHVDFDLRRPRLARIWGVELTTDKSFSHTLQNAGPNTPDFEKLVNKSSVENLDVICSLPPEGVSPATIFGSSVIGDFFAWARAHYDRVIIDSPPYGVVGDVVSLSTLVDGVLIMCCPDRTHFKPIQYCSRSLAEAGANILGVVVNDVEVSTASAFTPGTHHGYGRYGYGYGYGYWYGYGPSKRNKRGDGDNPVTKDASDGAAAAKAGAKDSAKPSKPIHSAVENDELTDDD